MSTREDWLWRIVTTGFLLAIQCAALAGGGRAPVLEAPNIEDMAALPDTRWVVGSGMSVGERQPGALYGIHPDGDVVAIYPHERQSEDRPAASATNCPGELPVGAFQPHGLARHLDEGTATLYVVNHGARESVEIFSVSGGNGSRPPRVQWRDCLPLPDHASGNSVAVAGDGRIFVTASGRAFAGKSPSGKGGDQGIPPSGVLIREPSGQWRKITIDGLAMTNGIVWHERSGNLFVADWSGGAVWQVDPDNPARSRKVPLGFLADNLRRGADETIWVAGHVASVPAVMECYLSEDAHCSLDSAVAGIDPGDLSVVCSQRIPATTFPAATVALPVGQSLWLGTFRGDKVLMAPRNSKTNADAGHCIRIRP